MALLAVLAQHCRKLARLNKGSVFQATTFQPLTVSGLKSFERSHRIFYLTSPTWHKCSVAWDLSLECNDTYRRQYIGSIIL